ncbi:MAG: hypothetical protein U0168_03950 [Nannocystaceae bacterium]
MPVSLLLVALSVVAAVVLVSAVSVADEDVVVIEVEPPLVPLDELSGCTDMRGLERHAAAPSTVAATIMIRDRPGREPLSPVQPLIAPCPEPAPSPACCPTLI